MVHCDFNYLKQIYFGYDVEIRTYVTKIGKTSLTLTHEAWQNGKLRANGTCTMVYFDFIKQSSVVIAEDIREKLKEHYITKEDLENSNKKEMKENKNNKESVDYIESDL
jgi:acyl-CoA thioester hydrolase